MGHCRAGEVTPVPGRCLEKSERRGFFPVLPEIWAFSAVKSTFGCFTKMSFGSFTEMDCLILDNSLLVIEKLGVVTKPGEVCASFIFAQCFSFLPALAELFCVLLGLARAALAELGKPLLATAVTS